MDTTNIAKNYVRNIGCKQRRAQPVGHPHAQPTIIINYVISSSHNNGGSTLPAVTRTESSPIWPATNCSNLNVWGHPLSVGPSATGGMKRPYLRHCL